MNPNDCNDSSEQALPVKQFKYVCLRTLVGPSKGGKFFSMNSPNPEFSAKGERWYEVIGYANTVHEAQQICYGFST